MYEKILVPLDGSKLAEVALIYAEELAGRLGSEITLVSVSDSAGAREYHKHQIYLGKIIEATRRRAAKYREQSKDKEIKTELEVLVGHPAEEILAYADTENIGLIVMATHGRSGITRWALGSVADKVVRATRTPVALIRAKGARPDVRKKGIMNKTLVPLDGSKESEAVIPYVKELADKLKTEVTLLQVVAEPFHASADAESYLEKTGRLLKSEDITVNYDTRVGAAAEEIIKLADEANMDMIVMSTHGRSGIRRWTLGSVADRVLNGGNTPILLVRARGARTK